jgi:hypothetical protein
MTTTMVYHAAVRGIKLEEVESELEGDIDLKGFLAISDKVRPGYQEIRANFKVKNDIENAPASANPVACCGVSERITIKWIISLHFEIINWTPH